MDKLNFLHQHETLSSFPIILCRNDKNKLKIEREKILDRDGYFVSFKCEGVEPSLGVPSDQFCQYPQDSACNFFETIFLS
jgi:hypothetical protein